MNTTNVVLIKTINVRFVKANAASLLSNIPPLKSSASALSVQEHHVVTLAT